MVEQEHFFDGATDQAPTAASNKGSTRRALTIDVERYQSYLDGGDLSDAEKEAFLQALWNIICAFVDLGYELNPVQKFSGEAVAKAHERALASADVVSSSPPSTTPKKAAPRKRKLREDRIPQ
jgi:hypothetical protein